MSENTIYALIWILFMAFVAIPLVIILVSVEKAKRRKRIEEYKNTTYFKSTGVPYDYLFKDKGKYGEYMIYKILSGFETDGARFLFNVYLPKKDNTTTELDVVMIYKKFVVVFESKNYGGWIYGDEKKTWWYQTFKNGHKEKFYNPIMQNKTHISSIKEVLGKDTLILSYIVFSDDCVFKNINNSCTEAGIIQRKHLWNTINHACNCIPKESITLTEIASIYYTLLPYMRVDNQVKMQHIDNINKKIK